MAERDIYNGNVVHINENYLPRYEQAGARPVIGAGEKYNVHGYIGTIPEGFVGVPIEEFTPELWDRMAENDENRNTA